MLAVHELIKRKWKNYRFGWSKRSETWTKL